MPVIKTVKPSGGDYTSIAAWENARQGDLTSTDSEFCEVYAGTTETGVLIDGWTTTAANYIKIYAAAVDRFFGVYDASKAKMDTADTNQITIREDFVVIDGMQFKTTSSGSAANSVITTLVGSSGVIVVSHCLFDRGTTGSFIGGVTSSSGGTVYAINCTFYTTSAATNLANVSAKNNGTGALYVYSCTGIGGYRGFLRSSGTMVCKNCYSGNATTGNNFVSATLTTCGSSDLTGSLGLRSIPVNTTQFINVTYATMDLRLAAGSALRNVGTDTSGEAAPLNFIDDITYWLRIAPWDIGSHNFSSSPPDPPECTGTSDIAIAPGTMILTGSGTGTNANVWRVVRTSDSVVMNNGTTATATISFVAEYAVEYQLQFAWDPVLSWSSTGCTFTVDNPKPPWEPDFTYVCGRTCPLPPIRRGGQAEPVQYDDTNRVLVLPFQFNPGPYLVGFSFQTIVTKKPLYSSTASNLTIEGLDQKSFPCFPEGTLEISAFPEALVSINNRPTGEVEFGAMPTGTVRCILQAP